MKIKWFGHSCFLLTGETDAGAGSRAGITSGIRVLTDPFNEDVGYPYFPIEADLVTVSHGHGDHHCLERVKGEYKLADKAGSFTFRDVSVKGIPTFHDMEHGRKRGPNLIFVISIGGLKVCHCGDLGHPLDQKTREEIGPVDILLLPVGGYYTIDHKTAYETVKLLNPKITVPMHYKLDVVGYPIEKVDAFLSHFSNVQRISGPEVSITRDTVNSMAPVLVFEKFAEN